MEKHMLLNNEIMNRVEGFFQIDKDQEAIQAFLGVVNRQMKSFESPFKKLKWLMIHGYYQNFLEQYSEDVIRDIQTAVYDYNFSFQSYMAISKFYKDYALKTNDGSQFLETYEDRIIAVALYLGNGDETMAKSLAISMIEQRYQPATPTFLNAGRKKRGEMVSCFLLEIDDSLNSITYNLSTAMQLSKIGGGVALNLSKLRARGEAIKGIENVGSGVLPVMKLLEDSFSYVNQLGQRPGAGAAYLNIFHWDIEEFLDTKKINADEKSRIQTLSIGLVVPDKFIELARNNEPFYVFAPYTVYKEMNKHLDDLDIDTCYDELVANPKIKKRQLDARKVLIQIAKMQFESGYPYMMFKSNVNRQHALHELGQIKISNLCTEIFQLQETSVINDYQIEDEIKRDVSCNLGSLNIVNVMERGAIKESVYAGMDALTQVSDLSNIENAPGINLANKSLHAVGLGAMNLHGYLAKNHIMYESDIAREFVDVFFAAMNFYSIERSMHIAKDKQETFDGFTQSDYATGAYFDKYVEQDYLPVSEKVKSLFSGMTLPTKRDWQQLKENVALHGMYHAYRLAIAPTQSISYIQNATSSILPVVDLIERRTYKNATTIYPMPYLAPQTVLYYKSAYHMNMMRVIDLVAVAQAHIDQGISTTLFVDSNTSTRDLVRYYLYAHHVGLKALYYTRTKNLAFEECLSCSV